MSIIQKIYYGVPGTGKSYEVDQFLKINNIPTSNIFRVTFHPDYTYSDFVGQILPTSENGNIKYDFVAGIFTQALQKAFEDRAKKVFLIIEEMNRGNVSAIFGDIFQLLDRNENNFSRYPIRNTLISNQIKQIDNDEDTIFLPENFNIIATVNTSDQNLFVMDNAFQRRFDWKYIPTSPVLDSSGNIHEDYKFQFEMFWNNDIKEIEWTEFYIILNNYITDRTNGLGLREDKQIGQFFISYNNRTSQQQFRTYIVEKLMRYLWNDVHLITYNSESIFDKSITNFSNLYDKIYNNEKVFSDHFIDYYEKN